MPYRLRALTALDWPEVAEIYAEGIATKVATFETRVPPYEVWDQDHRAGCRWVAEDDEGEAVRVLGWTALAPVSARRVYAGVAEVSVYVARRAWGRGIGRALLERLIACSEQAGIWTLQAGIIAENEVSIRLHERCGFRVMGTRERVAKLDGVWRDTVLMERRSGVVGVE